MKIRIGTRKSRLAHAQTQMVADRIKDKFPDTEIEIINITTTGDRISDRPLTEIGGKGVFVSEIENALKNSIIDIAVHSAQDLPVSLSCGLEISGVLQRGDYRDVLVIKKGHHIENDKSFIVGTGSLRRRLNLQKIYPHVSFENIRGNVDTRLDKLLSLKYDGIILAASGIERLGFASDERFEFFYFDYTQFLPAPCQGVVAIESRENDFVTPIINQINDKNTYLSFETERYIIKFLNGGCGVPLGAYSFMENDNISVFLSKDCKKVVSGKGKTENRFRLAEELICSYE